MQQTRFHENIHALTERGAARRVIAVMMQVTLSKKRSLVPGLRYLRPETGLVEAGSFLGALQRRDTGPAT
jgi:hypothetical protein